MDMTLAALGKAITDLGAEIDKAITHAQWSRVRVKSAQLRGCLDELAKTLA